MTENATMPRVWTVGELMSAVRADLESRFGTVDLEGEITGFRIWTSGHVYFTLKDSSAQISAVMFASDAQRCEAVSSLKDGSKVKVRGRVSASPRSQCQIIVRRLRLSGEGELMRRFLELKAKLESEGLFDPSRKKPLPFLPRRIGVVTSLSGAVVHDICRVLMRRFPAVEIRLYPCSVQGEAAPGTVIAGLGYFNREWKADLVIFGRGGGSYEDLFCYNDEALVRAVASSSVPTVAAIGHETDFTLCDFAADVRAGTPSMAAELAVPELGALLSSVARLQSSLALALRGKYEWFAQRLDRLSADISFSLQNRSADCARRLELATSRLALLSPYSVLDRGYSITADENGRTVTDASVLSPGQKVRTRLAKGSFESITL